MPDKNDEKDNNSNEVPGCRMKMGGEPERGDGDGMVTGPSLFQIPLSHALRT